ncbi:MAG TPA: carbon-nitrogen hydrolase family protein, partial [Candidatus Thermoplasmatota archaeon]|nr:carbon-nitrogen hydrolase family protein [Candidatus Thermoplasmatota archaeon]
MRRTRVAVWQMEPRPRDADANFAMIDKALSSRAATDADVFVAPEMFATGWMALNGQDPRPLKLPERVAKRAREHGTMIATSLPVRRGNRNYNTFHVWGKDGRLLGVQDKIHLWAEESNETTPGRSPRAVTTPVGRVGGVICYDVEFPEVTRRLAGQGAELFLVPAAFYSPQSWDLVTRTRALENGCFLAAANQIGGDPSHPHNGQSRIVDPYGTVLAEVRGSKSGVVAADLDPAR